MSSISRRVRVSRCRCAGGDRRRAGQRHVDRVGGERAARARRPRAPPRRCLELGLERLAGLVGALADRAALGRLELADAAQDRGQLGLAAEVADPQLLELRPRRRPRRSPPRPPLGSLRCARSSLQRLRHAAPAAADDIRCRAIAAAGGDVERLGARRGAGSSRRSVAALERRLGRGPRARRPRHERRRPEASIVVEVGPAVGDERQARRRRRARASAPLGRPGEDRAHARPHGLRADTGRRSRGRARPGRRASACAVRMIVPTLPGSATPCEVDAAARRARRAGSGSGQTRDHPGAGAQRSRPRRAAPARPSLARRAGTNSGRDSTTGSSRPRARPRAGPRPRSTNRPSRSRCLRSRELADQLQLLVVGARDRLIISVWSSRLVLGNKKGRPLRGRPGEVVVCGRG